MVRSHEGGPVPAPDQDPTPDDAPDQAPDQSPEEKADQENRVRDAEILGQSFKVRLTIDRSVTSAIGGMHEKTAKFKNAMSAPKNAYLEMRYLSAQDKHARKLGKVGSSHFKFMNSHHKRVADKYESRMNEKKGAFDSHTNKMQGRIDRAQGHRDRHDQIHKKKIEMYRDRKTMAQGRKEIRKMRGNLREDGKSRIEVNRIVSAITPEQRKQMGAIACRQEGVQRTVDRATRQKNRLESRQKNNGEQINYNRETIEDKTKTRDKAAENAAGAHELRAAFSQEADDLQNQLDSGVDDEGTELLETGRAKIQEKLDKARANAEQAELKIKEFDDQVRRLDSEVTALQRDTQTREQKAEGLNDSLSEVDTTLSEHNAKVSALEQERQSVINGAAQQVPPVAPPVQPTPLPAAPAPAPDSNAPDQNERQAA